MKIEGQSQPKIGIEEFMSIAERFGFSKAGLRRIRGAARLADLGPGPNLARWACPYPTQTKGDAFEKLACRKFGVTYARGASSGTGALHSAMAALGVGPGVEVIVPAIGFLATSAVVVTLGGKPVFCDVDDSLQIDPTKIEALITPRTVAIAPTHWLGGVCDLAPILRLARARKIKVIEDCAQAPGGKYRGRYVGSLGDIGCFSISAYKIIGGGEGGLIITSDQRLWERANQFMECGGLWRLPGRFDPPRYKGELFCGTNYRLSELEAAVDLVQLKKLDGVVLRNHANHHRVRAGLQSFREIRLQKLNDPNGVVGYYLGLFPADRALSLAIAGDLRAAGLGIWARGPNPGPDWHLATEMLPLREYVPTKDTCPVAEDLFNRAVLVGMNQWWTAGDCRRVAATINEVLAKHCTPA